MPIAVTAWMTLAATGAGFTILRVTGLMGALTHAERLAIAFVLGIGMIGWLAFFPGLSGNFNGSWFAAILALCSVGLVFARKPARGDDHHLSLNGIEWVLLAGLCAAVLMDLSEALSPAADADTMAYHFETPRLYLERGGIFAIPRAIDGATQLLLQMTYAVAMDLGGETAAKLWVMVSGWGLGALFYVLARRHLDRVWALGGVLLLMTTPAVVYGAGTGQVEVRLAAFALLSAYAVAMSAREDADPALGFGWVIVAGLAAGFFAGAKSTGLIFAFAGCIAMLGRTVPIKRMCVFSICVALAGVQWYAFNWSQTGDPLYPLLWRHVDLAAGYQWNDALAQSLERQWQNERGAVRGIGWFFAYPIRTVLAPFPQFESLRVGLGPAALMFLPFAGAAFVMKRDALKSPLFRLAMIAFLVYAIWYAVGPSLRIRHLLPVYPLALLAILAGTAHLSRTQAGLRRIALAGFAAVIALQLAGQGLFSKKYISYLASDESRTDFLNGSISGYDAVKWINANLTPDDRVLVFKREWLYLLQVPHYFGNNGSQALIPLYEGATPETFLAGLRTQSITHIATTTTLTERNDKLAEFLKALVTGRCIAPITEIRSAGYQSRTLQSPSRGDDVIYTIYRVSPAACRPA